MSNQGKPNANKLKNNSGGPQRGKPRYVLFLSENIINQLIAVAQAVSHLANERLIQNRDHRILIVVVSTQVMEQNRTNTLNQTSPHQRTLKALKRLKSSINRYVEKIRYHFFQKIYFFFQRTPEKAHSNSNGNTNRGQDQPNNNNQRVYAQKTYPYAPPQFANGNIPPGAIPQPIPMGPISPQHPIPIQGYPISPGLSIF